MDAYQYQQCVSIENGIAALAEPAFQTPRLKRLRADLVAANKVIKELYAAQSSESVGWDGDELDRLRAALRKRLMSISADAKVRLEGLPGVHDFFNVPHKRTKDDDLFVVTERVLRHAKEYEETFIEGGLHKDFIRRAQAAADTLEAKLADGNTAMNRRSRATASLDDAIRKGRDIMRSVTTAVNEDLEDNPVAIKRWARAMRVPQKVGRPKNNRRGRRIYPPPKDDAD